MKKIIANLVLIAFLLILGQAPAFCQGKTITAIGDYTMGEGETMLVAKDRALTVAMRNAVEQAGVYVESYSQVNNAQLTKDEINVIASGIIEITDKHFTQRLTDAGGMYFTVTITTNVDSSKIEAMQNSLAAKATLDTYKQIQLDYANSQNEVEKLKRQLIDAKTAPEQKQAEIGIANNEQQFTSVQWFEKGYKYDRNGDYDNAIIAYSKTIELNPQSYFTFYNRGVVYSAKGQYDLAIADYSQSLAINPQYTEAYNNRGIAYAHKAQYDLAIADYTQAIALDSTCALAYNNRGLAYAAKHQFRAIDDYSQAIALNPQYAQAYFNKATTYHNTGYNREAISYYQQFIDHALPKDAQLVAEAKRRIIYLGG